MFSENNQISGRQIFRLLSYDLIGLSTLLLPPLLSKIAGVDGIFCMVVGTIAGLLYLGLLSMVVKKMKVDFSTFLRMRCGVIVEKIILLFYFTYFLLFAGMTAFLFSELVVENLLKEESFYLILALLLLLAGYGVRSGIEGRARIYELLFWFLMIPLMLMLIFACKEVDVDLWTPVFSASWKSFWKGTYFVFLWESLIFLILFFYPYVTEKRSLILNGRRAILFTGVLNLILYMILTGVFGSAALSDMDYPAVTLMSIVQMPGGFLKRTDAFMFGIWFFTLYALLNGLIFYSAKTGKAVIRKGKEGVYLIGVLCLVFLLAVLCYRKMAWKKAISWLIWTVGTPIATLLPLLLMFLPERKKGGKATKVLSVLFLLGAGNLLTGCHTLEVEDREFPLAVAVEKREDIEALWLNQEEAGNKEMDYNHLKVMILSEELMQDGEAMEELLGVLKANPEVPRNTYVVVAERPQEIMELKEEFAEEESVGTYLEELLEGNASMKETAYPTLGKLYQEKENHLETLFLPYLATQDKTPYIEKYFVWKRGTAAGIVDTGTAMLSAMMQGNLEKETIVLEDGNSLRISSFQVEEEFGEEKEERYLAVKISCEGETLYEKEKLGENREEKYERILEQYYQSMAEKMHRERVDISNSYKKIGGYQREWYSYYQENPDAFEEEVSIRIEIDLSLVR